MGHWLDVARVEDLPAGTRRVLQDEEFRVAVFNLGGKFFAFRDECPHDGGILSNGMLEGEVIVCPRHGARFSVKSGAVLGPPAYEDLRMFPVRVADGWVQVQLPD